MIILDSIIYALERSIHMLLLSMLNDLGADFFTVLTFLRQPKLSHVIDLFNLLKS